MNPKNRQNKPKHAKDLTNEIHNDSSIKSSTKEFIFHALFLVHDFAKITEKLDPLYKKASQLIQHIDDAVSNEETYLSYLKSDSTKILSYPQRLETRSYEFQSGIKKLQQEKKKLHKKLLSTAALFKDMEDTKEQKDKIEERNKLSQKLFQHAEHIQLQYHTLQNK